ncbi:VOC family protein [Ktedonospora formicarum]|uniref:Extradiol dioxygenase n=1 Tax=Ktedonospora formicarum TaxID=2778364 RepID=A0A8J3IBZ7_9CHLR|nr:VOC family protein [Ktedonospora formicarum]GHO49294.1 extradiol dioxygenase [Ktedonospora formicarum]
MNMSHVRQGGGTVRPYLYGRPELLNFVVQVFGAQELERSPTSKGGNHIEVQVGDSIIVLETGEPSESATRSSVYVYVEDVDATYRRALEAGAISLIAPENKTYHERNAGVKDTFGNVWWIGSLLTSN